MSYTTEKTPNGTDIVISGFDRGIAQSPHKGVANMQGVNITTDSGEAMCSFARIKESQTGTTGTLTQVNTNTVSISGITLKVGQVITITDAGTTGLDTPFTALTEVEALIVAGGGGGGTNIGGGGGGGGIYYTASNAVSAGAITVTVGAGGAAQASGSDSVFNGLTAYGGGGGGDVNQNGDNGGSGGGSGQNGTGGIGSQGRDGGSSGGTTYGAGGGGASAVGGTGGNPLAGNGGDGLAYTISGASTYYGGGGGGGDNFGNSTGGQGGGGGQGVAGTANTGGGGGGSNGAGAAAGGSGIVIVSYAGTTAKATGGTITTSGGRTIHTFTTSGTFTVLPSKTGQYYYLSTGKLYAGNLPPSDPDSASALTGISAGTATFTVSYPLAKPKQSAVETYFDSSGDKKYRYYILDEAGQVWCRDTATLANWDTPLWFFVGTVGTGASGLAVFNGWLTVANSYYAYWKLTSLLGSAFISTLSFGSNQDHVMLAGSQNTLYGTDGYTITSLFPNAALVGSAVNIQTYGSYTTTTTTVPVVNGTFTNNLSGWTFGAAWSYGTNNVVKGIDGTTTLSQSLPIVVARMYLLTFTISGWSAGSVTPSIAGINGSAVNADGTYTQAIFVSSLGSSDLVFTPTNTSRFTIDNVSLTLNETVGSIIGGSAPTTGNFSPRVPAIFFTDGTLPTAIVASTIYYIQWLVNRMEVYTAVSGGSALNLYTGAVGNQYWNAFDPTSSAGQTMQTFTPQALVLPFYETATCLAELGNNVIVGTTSNTVYPWNQVDLTPGDIIFLPENNTVNMVVINNTGYIFSGYNGNIYITNGSAASKALSVPDYCAGIAGTPKSYISPYLLWGGAMYLEGRVYFSVLDQTAAKTGNCGGIWSFVPTQNLFSGDDTGMALRVENQSSYGTYNGYSPVLLGSKDQSFIGPQYWTGWESSITSPTYGIDYSDVIPQTAIIETDLIPTGTMLGPKTFQQIEYKLSSPLVAGDSVSISYRQNSTDAFSSCGTVKVTSTTELSGYFTSNFQNGQWLQLQITLTPLASTTSSFIRFREVRVR